MIRKRARCFWLTLPLNRDARTIGTFIGRQILLCVEGEGWYQEEGNPAQRLIPGYVVTIPTNVKHWHGAQKGSWFSHIAVEVPGEETKTEWLERVSESEYDRLGTEE